MVGKKNWWLLGQHIYVYNCTRSTAEETFDHLEVMKFASLLALKKENNVSDFKQYVSTLTLAFVFPWAVYDKGTVEAPGVCDGARWWTGHQEPQILPWHWLGSFRTAQSQATIHT